MSIHGTSKEKDETFSIIYKQSALNPGETRRMNPFVQGILDQKSEFTSVMANPYWNGLPSALVSMNFNNNNGWSYSCENTNK